MSRCWVCQLPDAILSAVDEAARTGHPTCAAIARWLHTERGYNDVKLSTITSRLYGHTRRGHHERPKDADRE